MQGLETRGAKLAKGLARKGSHGSEAEVCGVAIEVESTWVWSAAKLSLSKVLCERRGVKGGVRGVLGEVESWMKWKVRERAGKRDENNSEHGTVSGGCLILQKTRHKHKSNKSSEKKSAISTRRRTSTRRKQRQQTMGESKRDEVEVTAARSGYGRALNASPPTACTGRGSSVFVCGTLGVQIASASTIHGGPTQGYCRILDHRYLCIVRCARKPA